MSQECHFFAKFFGENIFKIKTMITVFIFRVGCKVSYLGTKQDTWV
jgi:hypothetical protein